MAGKQEIKPGVVINYKEKLDDRFVDVSTQKTTTEANNYLTQFNTNLHSENKQTVESVSPYYYYSKVRSGAKSPLSVEMAQHIFKNTLEALEDALRAEIARAFSSEKYLSDFMKENMVTKSEDQSISGFKDFNSVQIDHADIDTEIADDIITRHINVTEDADIERNTNIGRDLHVSRNSQIDGNTNVGGSLNVDTGATINHSLRIPLTAPVSRVTGDIWYDPNITSPGGISGGSTDIGKQITVNQYSTNEVAMYDGSTHVATFTADNAVNDIILDGKIIKIPKGVILDNMNDSDSIDLEKNVSTNTVKISVKDAYINNLADIRASLAVTPVSEELTALKDQHSVDVNNLTGSIASTNSKIDSEKATLNASISSVNSTLTTRLATLETRVSDKIQTNDSAHSQIFSYISSISGRIDTFEEDQNTKHSALETAQDGILERLSAIDSNEATSLKSKVSELSESQIDLSRELDTISAQVTRIVSVINSLHGEGTI